MVRSPATRGRPSQLLLAFSASAHGPALHTVQLGLDGFIGVYIRYVGRLSPFQGAAQEWPTVDGNLMDRKLRRRSRRKVGMNRQRFFAIFNQHQGSPLEVHDLMQMRHSMTDQSLADP